MTFTSASWTLPPGWAFPVGNTVTISQPFTMTGSLSLSQSATGAPLLSNAITGAGDLHLTILSVQDASGTKGWSVTGIPATDFVFHTPTAAATPEPTTVLLMATGLTGVFWCRRRHAASSLLQRKAAAM
jgi:hypothetical protein